MIHTTACCGLSCITCPIYLATIEPDKSLQLSMRVSIAKTCSVYYKIELQANDINDCEGCWSENSRLFSGCLKCEIRNCANLKMLESCANCDEYACERLLNHFNLDPGARIRLEEIRQSSNQAQRPQS